MHKSEMDSTLLEPERGWVTLEVFVSQGFVSNPSPSRSGFA